MEMGVVVVKVVMEAEVAEEHHHQGPEGQDMEHLSPHTWITNCTTRVLTSLQETNRRPESLSPSETFTGASIIVQ